MNCPFSSEFIAVDLTEHAAAVILSIEVKLFREFYGVFIALMFFEVREEVRNAEFLSYRAAALVDEGAVFMRTDSQGSGEEVAAELFCLSSGSTESQLNAFLTSFATFGEVFETFCELIERFRVISIFQHLNIEIHFTDESF